jgi:hypothetical protein
MIMHELQTDKTGQNRTKSVITDKTGHAICIFTSWLFTFVKALGYGGTQLHKYVRDVFTLALPMYTVC